MVIFLDIDGVILPVGPLKGIANLRKVILDPFEHFDAMVEGHSRAAVFHVKQLCERYRAKLVLHSNWRRVFKDDFTRAYLDRVGLLGHFHEDWRCQMQFSSEKGHDIGMWLDDNPDVAKCIVIDDDEFYVHPEREHGVVEVIRIKPVSTVGLCADDVAAHLRRLADTLPDAL